MPVFVAALIGGLVSAASSLVGRVLLALGIGYVAYTGISALLDWLKAEVMSELSGLPAQGITILTLLKVDVGISIIFSAYAARLILAGVTSGAITRMVIK
jgi:Protein of unknown function (DUF2523)